MLGWLCLIVTMPNRPDNKCITFISTTDFKRLAYLYCICSYQVRTLFHCCLRLVCVSWSCPAIHFMKYETWLIRHGWFWHQKLLCLRKFHNLIWFAEAPISATEEAEEMLDGINKWCVLHVSQYRQSHEQGRLWQYAFLWWMPLEDFIILVFAFTGMSRTCTNLTGSSISLTLRLIWLCPWGARKVLVSGQKNSTGTLDSGSATRLSE